MILRMPFPSILLLTFLAIGCGDEVEPDAWGHFEATEVAVAAETGGRLVEFELEEGTKVKAGAVVGRIESTSTELQREELLRRREGAVARASEIPAQVDVLRAQLETATEEFERTRRLHQDGAATAEALNRQQGEVRVLQERIEATRTQARTAESEVASINAQIATIDESLRDAMIENPISGTVLTTCVETGELVTPNQRLYEVADLETLVLRAYVSGAQLPSIQIGERVIVYADSGQTTRRAYEGVVSWISSDAEFTPTPIQTREERVDLVYAVKVRVPNPDGFLKIGMPGEIELEDVASADRGE